jgi:hypothetical protein
MLNASELLDYRVNNIVLFVFYNWNMYTIDIEFSSILKSKELNYSVLKLKLTNNSYTPFDYSNLG